MATSKKSANGQGSIIKRANGTWEWRLTLHYVDGTTERKSVYGKTQTEVKQKGDRMLIEAKSVKQSPQTTVADLVQMFYVDADRRLTNNTIRQYKYVFDNYLVPQFGTLKLSAVKASTIDTLIDRARMQGYGNEDQRKAFKEHGTPIPPLGPNSLAILRRCTRALFSKAVEWELISKNPVTRSQSVKVERKLSQGMTPEQSQQYLQAFVTSPTAYPLAFALGTGIRIAECLGIKHTDIEERSGKFYLNLAQQLLIENERPVLRPLKTQNSRRVIPLNDTLVAIVNKQKIIQSRLGSKGDMGLLFTNTVGSPVNVNNLRRWMRTQLPKLGLEVITPHDLRRGFVSILVAANADIKTISALLGHADISTTLNIYAQANTKKKEEVMAQMELLLLGGEKSSSEQTSNQTASDSTGFPLKTPLTR